MTPETQLTVCNGLGARGGPLRVFLERFTRWQLLRCPALYSALYLIGVRWRPGRWLSSRLLYRVSRRRFASLIAEHCPNVVVCTYPGITGPLALMRQRGELPVPVCAVITDLASLYFWAHPGVDLHLASYAESLTEIKTIALDADVRIVRPPLRTAHWAPRERRLSRLKLGLDPDAPLVLVSGGGWGVGNFAGAIDAALMIEGAQVVVLCGENRRARDRLGARYAPGSRVKVLGYSNAMADLLAAASAIVHCTGGMTCLEAAAHGCPVIAYGRGAGHIAHNTSAMVRLGLIDQARDPHRLSALLQNAIANPARRRSRFADRPPAAAEILALAARHELVNQNEGRAPETLPWVVDKARDPFGDVSIHAQPAESAPLALNRGVEEADRNPLYGRQKA